MGALNGAGLAPVAAARVPAASLRNVRFRYPRARGDTIAIDELAVAASESLFVSGPSGCGKSTLLSLLAGVLVADRGEVRLLDVDWRALPAGKRDRRRADHIGYIFQQFNLLPYLTALDNVLLPCRVSAHRARRAGGSREAIHERATSLLARLGLAGEVCRRRADALSVGQQQRVAAARALIGNPELVIADEPTSALDEEAREAFMEHLLEACAAAGSALVFVSHDRRLATRFARELSLPALNRAAETP